MNSKPFAERSRSSRFIVYVNSQFLARAGPVLGAFHVRPGVSEHSLLARLLMHVETERKKFESS